MHRVIWKRFNFILCFQTTIRRPREVIPDAKTALSHLTWSPWRLALVPEGAAVSREEWLARRQGEPGLRRRTLFTSGLQREALYEVAVQPASGCKRYVTFLAATRGMPSDRRWETYILRSKKVNARISEVINQNCSLFIRRAFVPASASEASRSLHHPLKKAALRDNDYAWNRSRSRYITRRGIRMWSAIVIMKSIYVWRKMLILWYIADLTSIPWYHQLKRVSLSSAIVSIIHIHMLHIPNGFYIAHELCFEIGLWTQITGSLSALW